MEDVLMSMKGISAIIKVNDLINKAFDFGISKTHLKVNNN